MPLLQSTTIAAVYGMTLAGGIMAALCTQVGGDELWEGPIMSNPSRWFELVYD